MKILVVGSRGNMGSRYVAICKYLGHEVVECDIHNYGITKHEPPKVDHCIIATPIDKHYEWCLWCIENKTSFLCEKPISKNIEEIKTLKKMCDESHVDGRMVCNWVFLFAPLILMPNKYEIYLNYYNTGKDGIYDLIQPVYISKDFILKNTSPIYTCLINETKISQVDFDKSYLLMVALWLAESDLNNKKLFKYLWSLDDAIKAHEKLMKWKETNWNE